MSKKLRVSLDGNRFRVYAADVKRIIEPVEEQKSESGEILIKFGYIDEARREYTFKCDDLVPKEYGKGKFWITTTEPTRWGWTGKFPTDNRFAVTNRLPTKENFHQMKKLWEKLLRHFCRDLDKSSPFKDDIDIQMCSIFVEAFRKDGDPGKSNPFLHALLKKYENDPYLLVQEGVNPMRTIFESCSYEDNQELDHEASGTLRHKANYRERSDIDELITGVDTFSIDKSGETQKFVKDVREREEVILHELFPSKPIEALKLIMLVTRFDMLFSCDFESIIERLQKIKRSVDNCDEKVVKAKFYYHFGEILTKASRFDKAEEKLQEADTILTEILNHDQSIKFDLLSAKILLGRCQFLCLRNREADSQLQKAQDLIQEFVNSSNNAQERIHSYKIEALILSAEMAVKSCNYQKAAENSREALKLLTDTSLPRDWNSYILEATCTRLLGDALTNLSHLEEAEKCFVKALKLFVEYLDGDDHQEIAKCYVRLGDVKCLQRNFKVGLVFLLNSLEMRQRIFPNSKSNPEVAASLNRVGLAYHVIGNCEKAHSYFDQAREIRCNLYGDSHVSALYISYPSCLDSDDTMARACEQYDSWQVNATNPHLANASAKHRRGDIWFAQRDLNTALQCYEEVLHVRQELEHQLLAAAASHYTIGKCFVAKSDLERARKSFLEAKKLRSRVLNDDWESDVHLATVCLKQQNFGEAISHINAAIDKFNNIARLETMLGNPFRTAGMSDEEINSIMRVDEAIGHLDAVDRYQDDIRKGLDEVLRNIRTEAMSDEEVDRVVTMIWSIPTDPFLLI